MQVHVSLSVWSLAGREGDAHACLALVASAFSCCSECYAECCHDTDSFARALIPASLSPCPAAVAEYLSFVRNFVSGLSGDDLDSHLKASRLAWMQATADAPHSHSHSAAGSASSSVASSSSSVEPDPITKHALAEGMRLAGALPSASDSLALEFLHRYKYDIERAKFVLTAFLGAGREHAAIQRLSTINEERRKAAAAADASSSSAGDAGAGSESAPAANASGTAAQAAPSASLTPSLTHPLGQQPSMMATRVGDGLVDKGLSDQSCIAGTDLNLGLDIGFNSRWGEANVVAGLAASNDPDHSAALLDIDSGASRTLLAEPDASSDIPTQLAMQAAGADLSTGAAAGAAEVRSGASKAPASSSSTGAAATGSKYATLPPNFDGSSMDDTRALFKAWKDEVVVALAGRTAAWDKLVHLRAQGLDLFAACKASGSMNFIDAAIQTAASQLGFRLRAAVRFRARIRDAISGTLRMRGPLPVSRLELVLSEYPELRVEFKEYAIIKSICADGRQWIRTADELMRRVNASAGAVVAAELLHYEDSARAGPENPVATGADSDQFGLTAAASGAGGESDVAMDSAGSASGAALATSSSTGSNAGASSSSSSSAAGVPSSSPTPSPTGNNAAAAPALAPASATNGTSRRYAIRYAANIAAESKAAPVMITELVSMLKASDALPVGLWPMKADLQARLDRCKELAKLIQEQFPYYIGHPKTPAGTRVVQGYGLSRNIEGSDGASNLGALPAFDVAANSAVAVDAVGGMDAAADGTLAADASAGAPSSSGAGAAGGAEGKGGKGAGSRSKGGRASRGAAGKGKGDKSKVASAQENTNDRDDGETPSAAAAATPADASTPLPSSSPLPDGGPYSGMSRYELNTMGLSLNAAGVVVNSLSGLPVTFGAEGEVVGSGSMADGSATYVSHAGYHERYHNGSAGTMVTGVARRPRISMFHLEALARDVRDIGVCFAEGEVVKAYHQEALLWLARSHEAVAPNRRATVAEIRELLADADTIAVDFSERIAVLRFEVERARQWLDAIRTLLAKGAGRTRTGQSSSKNTSLQQITDMIEQMKGGVIASSGGDEAKEAATIVKSAQEWIAQVRAALDATNSAYAYSAKAGAGIGAGAGPSSSSSSDAARINMSSAITLDALTALLRQGEDIPVVTEEYRLLQGEVQARKWVVKAREYLAKDVGYRVESMKKLLEDIQTIRLVASGADPAALAFGAPVNVIITSPSGIDSSNSAASGNTFAIKSNVTTTGAEEETEIRRQIDMAEEWLDKAKQRGLPGPNNRLDSRSLDSFIREAIDIRINLAAEMRPFQAALYAAQQWASKAKPMIDRINARVAWAMQLKTSAASSSSSAASASSSSPAPPAAVPLTEARCLLQEALQLGCIPAGESELKAAVRAVDVWRDSASKFLPSAPDGNSYASGDAMQEDDDGAPADSATSGKTGLDEDGNLSIGSKPSMQAACDVVSQLVCLPLDAGELASGIVDEYRAARKWQSTARSLLIGIGAIPATQAAMATMDTQHDRAADAMLAGATGASIERVDSDVSSAAEAASSFGLSLASSPSEVLEVLETQLKAASTIRIGTKEEALIRRHVTLARWTVSGQRMAGVIEDRKHRIADLLDAGAAAASANIHVGPVSAGGAATGTNAGVDGIHVDAAAGSVKGHASSSAASSSSAVTSASSQPFIPIALPVSATMPGYSSPASIASIPVTTAKDDITWEAFLARRCDGPAARVAGAYWAAEPPTGSAAEAAELDNFDDAEFEPSQAAIDALLEPQLPGHVGQASRHSARAAASRKQPLDQSSSSGASSAPAVAVEPAPKRSRRQSALASSSAFSDSAAAESGAGTAISTTAEGGATGPASGVPENASAVPAPSSSTASEHALDAAAALSAAAAANAAAPSGAVTSRPPQRAPAWSAIDADPSLYVDLQQLRAIVASGEECGVDTQPAASSSAAPAELAVIEPEPTAIVPATSARGGKRGSASSGTAAAHASASKGKAKPAASSSSKSGAGKATRGSAAETAAASDDDEEEEDEEMDGGAGATGSTAKRGAGCKSTSKKAAAADADEPAAAAAEQLDEDEDVTISKPASSSSRRRANGTKAASSELERIAMGLGAFAGDGAAQTPGEPATILQSHARLRTELFSSLQSEAAKAEAWLSKASEILQHSSSVAPLPSALLLLYSGMRIAVKLDVMQFLRRSINHTRKWVSRALAALPPPGLGVPAELPAIMTTDEPGAGPGRPLGSTTSTNGPKLKRGRPSGKAKAASAPPSDATPAAAAASDAAASSSSAAGEPIAVDAGAQSTTRPRYPPQLTGGKKQLTNRLHRMKSTRVIAGTENRWYLHDGSGSVRGRGPSATVAVGAGAGAGGLKSPTRANASAGAGAEAGDAATGSSSSSRSDEEEAFAAAVEADAADERADASDAEGDDAVTVSASASGTATSSVPRPAIEVLEKLISESSLLRIAATALVKRLRLEARTGRKWLEVARSSGFERSLAAPATLQALVSASEFVWFDISATVSDIAAAATTYCVCHSMFRQPMVECPGCKGLFHYDCVGFRGADSDPQMSKTKNMRDQARRFRCPSCALQEATGTAIAAGLQSIYKLARQAEKQHKQPEQFNLVLSPNPSEVIARAMAVYHAGASIMLHNPSVESGQFTASFCEAPPQQFPVPAVAGLPSAQQNIHHAVMDVAPSMGCTRQASIQSMSLPFLHERQPQTLSPRALQWIERATATIDPQSSDEAAAYQSIRHIRRLVDEASAFSDQKWTPGAAMAPEGENLLAHPEIARVHRSLKALLWGKAASLVLQSAEGEGVMPSLVDMQLLAQAARGVSLLPPQSPMIRYINKCVAQAVAWKENAKKLLSARNGVTDLTPYLVALDAAQSIPVDLHIEEDRLTAVVEDKGQANCVCSGLADSTMVGCDTCNQWFHPVCVGIGKEQVDDPSYEFKCPPCCKKAKVPYPLADKMPKVGAVGPTAPNAGAASSSASSNAQVDAAMAETLRKIVDIVGIGSYFGMPKAPMDWYKPNPYHGANGRKLGSQNALPAPQAYPAASTTSSSSFAAVPAPTSVSSSRVVGLTATGAAGAAASSDVRVKHEPVYPSASPAASSSSSVVAAAATAAEYAVGSGPGKRRGRPPKNPYLGGNDPAPLGYNTMAAAMEKVSAAREAAVDAAGSMVSIGGPTGDDAQPASAAGSASASASAPQLGTASSSTAQNTMQYLGLNSVSNPFAAPEAANTSPGAVGSAAAAAGAGAGGSGGSSASAGRDDEDDYDEDEDDDGDSGSMVSGSVTTSGTASGRINGRLAKALESGYNVLGGVSGSGVTKSGRHLSQTRSAIASRIRRQQMKEERKSLKGMMMSNAVIAGAGPVDAAYAAAAAAAVAGGGMVYGLPVMNASGSAGMLVYDPASMAASMGLGMGIGLGAGAAGGWPPVVQHLPQGQGQGMQPAAGEKRPRVEEDDGPDTADV